MTRPQLSPSFNRLAWSNLAAQSAEQIGLAAAPIVAVLAFGAGACETGLLQTAQTLPYLIFAIPAGVLADRMSRRKLMAWAEGLRALSLAVILLLLQGGMLSLPLLAFLGFAGACIPSSGCGDFVFTDGAAAKTAGNGASDLKRGQAQTLQKGARLAFVYPLGHWKRRRNFEKNRAWPLFVR